MPHIPPLDSHTAMGLILRILSVICAVLAVAFGVGAVAAHVLSCTPLPYLVPCGTSLLLAVLFRFLGRRLPSESRSRRTAYLCVVSAWFTFSLLGMIPYLIYFPDISLVDAFFESTSGFTTSGMSVLPPALQMHIPRALVFWRCFSMWIGGIGIIMIVIVLLPSLHRSGSRLLSLESSVQEKISPRIRTSGYRFLLIYISLTLFGLLLLSLDPHPMSWFERVGYALSSISTGGMSPEGGGMVHCSPFSQVVLMLLMVMGGVNFVLYYSLFRLRIRRVWRDEEFRAYLKILLLSGIVVTILFFLKTDADSWQSLRRGFFMVVSVLTCTGFLSPDVTAVPEGVAAVLLVLTFIGGCSGSTSGGIKVFRFVLLRRNISVMFDRWVHPNSVRGVTYGGKSVEPSTSVSVFSFIFVYFLTFAVGIILLVFSGIPGSEAATVVSASLSSLGVVWAPISSYPPFAKFLLSVLMILGRLEIYPLLILFLPAFWRKV